LEAAQPCLLRHQPAGIVVYYDSGVDYVSRAVFHFRIPVIRLFFCSGNPRYGGEHEVL
jgi:hypothetical protein